jgi:hypothetical protein
MEKLVLLTAEEAALRYDSLQRLMRQEGIGSLLVCDNANLLALCGRVYAGYAWIPADGAPVWFVRRPVELEGDNVAYIRKPEEIPSVLQGAGITLEGTVGLEMDLTSYTGIERLKAVFATHECVNASDVLRRWRSVKTPAQVALLRRSGVLHAGVMRRVPRLFRMGMTDLELQVEIERLSRLHGCLGLFRISGPSMELFMGNVISGRNADTPTPYDFAMGGAGTDPSLPVGANGSEILNNTAVMVDVNGNYTGYMTDMTRVYSLGTLPALALDAHRCSIDICHRFQEMAVPGTEAKALYAMAEEMVRARGLERYFMGHRQHAGFIGHGIGIEVNELPVIAPRSRDILTAGNVIACEPKFVIPEVGAVGIENTYLVGSGDAPAECLTECDEEIVSLI